MVPGIIDIKAHVNNQLCHKTSPLVPGVAGAELTTLRYPSLMVAIHSAKKGTSISSIPWVQPESIAQLLVFLATDEARAINGALIPIGST